MQRAGGFHSANDGRGLHVTNMPQNDNRANLSELTIRTDSYAGMSAAGHQPPEQWDEESGRYESDLNARK